MGSPLKYIISSLALSLFIESQALAREPYRSSVTGDVRPLKEVASNLEDGRLRRGTPSFSSRYIRLSFSTNGMRRVKVVFDSFSAKSWESYFYNHDVLEPDLKDVLLVRGYLRRGGRRESVGGAIYISRDTPTLFFVLKSSSLRRSSGYISIPIKSSDKILTAKVAYSPLASSQSSAGCGVQDELPVVEGSSNRFLRAEIPSWGWGVKLWTEADFEYYSIYKGETNAHIATLINAAGAVYGKQLNINFTIGRQIAYTSSVGSPYTASNSNQLLNQFQNYLRSRGALSNANANAFHLFTGKDLDGTVVGLAYVGVVCTVPEYSVGLSQRFDPTSDMSIFAHELGHILGAYHDTSDLNSLMSPSVTIPGSVYFSNYSLGQMRAYLSGITNNNICFDESNSPASRALQSLFLLLN